MFICMLYFRRSKPTTLNGPKMIENVFDSDDFVFGLIALTFRIVRDTTCKQNNPAQQAGACFVVVLECGHHTVQWLRKWRSALSVGAARCVADSIDAAVSATKAAFGVSGQEH